MRSLLALLLLATTAHAAQGIPRWERLVDEILQRVEQQPHPPQPTGQPQAAPDPHPTVDHFLRYFQTTGAATFRRAAARLAPLQPMITEIFAQEGVPPELLWLGLVESGYQPHARSPKNALGVWQFIPDTARRFGLAVTPQRDERTDTVKATRAAARYLRFLYDTFGDWPLALAAYNAGEARVQSAMDRAGTRDFFALADAGYLPRETRAYVPAVLAAQSLGTGPFPGLTSRYAQRRTPRAPSQTMDAPFSLSR